MKVSQRQPLHYDPRLPKGWSRVITVGQDMTCKVSILDDMGHVFGSRQDLQTYIMRSGQRLMVDPNKIDFSVYGESL